MFVKRVIRVSLEEIDPNGIFQNVFRQYLDEVDGRELFPATLGALRQKYGLNFPQFKAQEARHLEEQSKKREKERERRRNNYTHTGGDQNGDGSGGNRGKRVYSDRGKDRGDY